MTKLDKLTRIAQQERAEVELAAALDRMRAAAVALNQYDEDLFGMAVCTIAQIEALQKAAAK